MEAFATLAFPFLRCRESSLSLDRPRVMGVVNVTPDSFSDGGLFRNAAAAVAHGRELVAAGADLVDVGGESTRPGAAEVVEVEELRRVIPVIEGLADCGVPVSVDTRKPGVMREALRAGASMINDVTALQAEGALRLAAESGAAVCLMHMQGRPASMQQAPRYADVVAEVAEFLLHRARSCVDGGIPGECICVDPGFGFGKTLAHNLALLRRLPEIRGLGWPVLVGLSRKSMIGALVARPDGDRLAGSLAAALAAVARGASIVRVHDVAETVDALRVWAAAEV
jgi:dihydropteroate synthase